MTPNNLIWQVQWIKIQKMKNEKQINNKQNHQSNKNGLEAI